MIVVGLARLTQWSGRVLALLVALPILWVCATGLIYGGGERIERDEIDAAFDAPSVATSNASPATAVPGTPVGRGDGNSVDNVVSSLRWSVYGRSIRIALITVLLSFLVAIPAVCLLSTAQQEWMRGLVIAVASWPLLAPACCIGYAWELLATRPGVWGTLFTAIGWHADSMRPFVASFVQAMWLWPIPAMIAGMAMRRQGNAAFQLARLDAGAFDSVWRAVLPAIRKPLWIAATVVFLLSITDGTIGPLMRVPNVWARELLADALDAVRFGDPFGYLMRQAWPMMLIIAGTMAVCFRGGMQRRASFDEHEWIPQQLTLRPVMQWICRLIVATISLLPLAVFVAEFSISPIRFAQAMNEAIALHREEFEATIAVASVSMGIALALGIAMLRLPRSCGGRIMATSAAVALLLTAILPTTVVGQAMISLLNRDWALPAGWPHPYDDLPLAWIGGIMAHYGFVPIVIVWLAQRWIGNGSAEQAQSDGATSAQWLAFVRIPELIIPLFMGELLVGCLAFSDVQVSSMLIPARFGGSLAAAVESQVHFGRNSVVVALCLLSILPAMLTAVSMPLLWAVSVRRRQSGVKVVRTERRPRL